MKLLKRPRKTMPNVDSLNLLDLNRSQDPIKLTPTSYQMIPLSTMNKMKKHLELVK